MIQRRAAAVLPALVLVSALLGACGGGDDDTDAAASSSAPSSSARATTSGSAAAITPATRGDDSTDAPPFPANTEPDADEASGGGLTVTEVRTGLHDGFDRVVFELDGTGTAGWDVRYVREAIEQGRGNTIPVEGDAILQVTISGVGYPTETSIEEYDGSLPLPGSGTEVVTEVVWDSTFEGTSVAFVGTTAETPFRVYRLDNPPRLVLDVVHPR
jgi:hypothetical protein